MTDRDEGRREREWVEAVRERLVEHNECFCDEGGACSICEASVALGNYADRLRAPGDRRMTELPTTCECGGTMHYEHFSGRVFGHCLSCTPSDTEDVGKEDLANEVYEVLKKVHAGEDPKRYTDYLMSRFRARLRRADRDEGRTEAAERLKAYVRTNGQAGCRMLSGGDDCKCPLCEIDRLFAPASDTEDVDIGEPLSRGRRGGGRHE